METPSIYDLTPITPYFTTEDGRELGLSLARMVERQRRLRLHLRQNPTARDFAVLVDVVEHEAGFAPRFLGQTVEDCYRWLCRHSAPQARRFMQWYECEIDKQRQALRVIERKPLNRYCIEQPTPRFASSLEQALAALPQAAAPVVQWLGTIRGLPKKGIKHEEIEESGVLARLERLQPEHRLSREQVLQRVRLDHVMPRLVCESYYDFVAMAGWSEVFQRLSFFSLRQRKLYQNGADTLYIIRYTHNSLGWSLARMRYQDLFITQKHAWCVLDHDGCLAGWPDHPLSTVQEAREYAESLMSAHFAVWGKHLRRNAWQNVSLPGGENYREMLLQLQNWPHNFTSRHFSTRNVLVHLRTSVRRDEGGRRLLYLDEVQSDWHAEVQYRGNTAPAPFAREWPLLALKTMLWWAQYLGLDGLTWSNADIQQQRWGKYNRPPLLLYRSILPKAARQLASALGCSVRCAWFLVRGNDRQVKRADTGWLVTNATGCPLTKPFKNRQQAERFADLTGQFEWYELPVIWLSDAPRLTALPLWGADFRGASATTPRPA